MSSTRKCEIVKIIIRIIDKGIFEVLEVLHVLKSFCNYSACFMNNDE